MSCPSAEELVSFAAGTLAGASQHAIELHLDVCSLCRTSVAELVRGAAKPESFGRYRIDGELGRGGMGIVFRGWDPDLSRAVAIKVVRHGDEQHRARLVREAQSLARLSHPHVCHVYDVGQDHDEVWFAMELIDGVTLRTYSIGHTFDQIQRVLLAAAEGLAAAHRAGLVHRDVKPDNILVDRAGRAVVTDFGLARVVASDRAGPTLTATGVIFGSPGYMAPEQLSGTDVDARADQFAWAVSAWELLVASPALPADPTARLAAIAAGLAPPEALPPAFGAALVRALSLEPAARFTSMDELLDALRGPPARRRRSRRGAVVGAIAATALAAGIVAIAMRPHSDVQLAVPIANAAPPTIDAAPVSTPDASAQLPLPPGYHRFAPMTALHEVDPDLELHRELDEARKNHADAALAWLDIDGLNADGHVDLTRGGVITTIIVSPSAYRLGQPQSTTRFFLAQSTGYFMHDNDGLKTLPLPRCTARAIWQRVAARRKLPHGGVARVRYSDEGGGPRWSFTMGRLDLTLRDDC